MTGLGVATACLIFLPGLLVLLAWIDFKRRTIPNALNATIALIGAFRAAALGGSPAVVETILQAMIVAAAVWLLRWLYFVIRRQQGLGLGDVKLLTASTFWVGMVGIPLQLLSASLSALAVVATYMRLATPSHGGARSRLDHFWLLGCSSPLLRRKVDGSFDSYTSGHPQGGFCQPWAFEPSSLERRQSRE
ncbi:prepilin peptidase [Bradyrhizobium sp. SZCCHNRI2007]|uniref:prepilin peptidase n=1 Tax=unclassified Bradyrhizobium TaxID=2631580 RepID=UPI00396579A8